MKLIFICTNYNNSDYTRVAVSSIMRNVGHDVKVIVVDNASGPKDVQVLKDLEKKFNSIKVIYSQKNVGYFPGINLGIDAARNDRLNKDAWILIGNNDLEFSCEFCNRLESQLTEYENYSVISPDVITLDGMHQNPHVISNISSIRELFYDLYYSNYWVGGLIYKLAKMFSIISRRGDEDEWEIARTIYQGHGSCYLLTPRFFRFFNNLWSPTFMMYEEFFLSLQLKEVGEKIFYSPAIQVKHHWHGALEKLSGKIRWKMGKDGHNEYRKYVKAWGQSNGK